MRMVLKFHSPDYSFKHCAKTKMKKKGSCYWRINATPELNSRKSNVRLTKKLPLWVHSSRQHWRASINREAIKREKHLELMTSYQGEWGLGFISTPSALCEIPRPGIARVQYLTKEYLFCSFQNALSPLAHSSLPYVRKHWSPITVKKAFQSTP